MRISQDKIERIKKALEYDSDAASGAMAKRFGVSASTINKFRKELGLPIQHGRENLSEIFKRAKTPDKPYFDFGHI